MPRSESPPPHKRARQSAERENGMSLPPLSLSILGVEPLDEFIREIADFIHYTIVNRPPRYPGKGRGRGKETIIAPDSMPIRFESNMSVAQHKHFNTRLNELKISSAQPGFPSTPLGYTHLHLTGNVIECMRKIRLGDLNIYSPKRAADWRVSVNLEVPVSHPVGSATHTRKKDRLSYSHEEFSIDLTQVTASGSLNSSPDILHELEIEIARPQLLLATAAKRGDPNVPELERSAFDELIRALAIKSGVVVAGVVFVSLSACLFIPRPFRLLFATCILAIGSIPVGTPLNCVYCAIVRPHAATPSPAKMV
ncbi:mRNA-capping enzyme subunit beta [Mycena venus]|uniref:mRNA-capping enzyme subunit beta n=1 Tax=Mycena venus TaxID=2733690 RepID=A0A8H7DA85_9AGAR|nr:mRNA-capping enzyme subunit beta [Mycena venus]